MMIALNQIVPDIKNDVLLRSLIDVYESDMYKYAPTLSMVINNFHTSFISSLRRLVSNIDKDISTASNNAEKVTRWISEDTLKVGNSLGEENLMVFFVAFFVSIIGGIHWYNAMKDNEMGEKIAFNKAKYIEERHKKENDSNEMKELISKFLSSKMFENFSNEIMTGDRCKEEINVKNMKLFQTCMESNLFRDEKHLDQRSIYRRIKRLAHESCSKNIKAGCMKRSCHRTIGRTLR